MNEQARACLPALRIVAIAILVSLLWKIRAFLFAFGVYRSFPLQHAFFPELFRSTGTVLAAYVVSILSVLYLTVGSQPSRLTGAAISALGSLGILCVHQCSYHDVTFITCGWTVAWCFWLIRRLGEPAGLLMIRAAFLAHGILSMIFLGGTVGKLTPGYWSGEVFFGIYFESRDYWLFNLLRGSWTTEQLMVISSWYSRFVIMVEGIGACLWLMPTRLASFLAIAILCNIALLSNTQLFSVVTCLIGLALASLHQPTVKSS